MSPRSALAFAAALATTLLCADAAGDTPVGATPSPDASVEAPPAPDAPEAPPVIGGAGYLRLRSAARVQTDGGSDLRLPPGYYLDEDNYARIDREVRRLQDQETRLAAENRSLRSSLAGWQPGWRTLAVTLILGTVTGFYLHSRF